MVATLLITILLIIAVIILLIVLALYLVPVVISTVAECSREIARVTAVISWGFVGTRLRIEDEVRTLEIMIFGYPIIRRDLRAQPAPPPEEKKEEEERPRLKVSDYLGAATDLWPSIRQIMDAFFRSLALEKLQGDIILGLESPANTGIVYGYCTALRYMLWPAEAVDIKMTPIFDREVLEGTLTLRLKIRHPLLILIPVAAALTRKPVRQRIRQLSGRGVSGA
jgi:hypothetical protein